MHQLASAFMALTIAVVGTCTITFILSSVRYQLAMSRARSSSSTDVRSPIIPYWIPWLGSSLSFLTPNPGKFYSDVLTTHPSEMGFFGTVLAGEVNHIVYSARAVQALFKVKAVVAHREHLTKEILTKSLGVSVADFDSMLTGGQLVHMVKDEEMNSELLLRQQAVNENTGTYVEFLKDHLEAWVRALGPAAASGVDGKGEVEVVVNFYDWLQKLMFRPSCKAFLGDRLNDLYPELQADFWRFDRSMLDLLFGIPKFIKPVPYQVRDRLVENITRWVEQGDAELVKQNSSGGEEQDRILPDPYNPEAEWEPIWGSRLSRFRQARWTSEGVTPRGRASMELGFLFGLNSNVIPATGWMLMHILDPKNPELLPRVLTELRRAAIPAQGKTASCIEDINLDINVLTVQPLLLSLYQEVLRRYVDVLVARKAEQDFRLPLDSTTPEGKPHMLLVKKGETIITPNIVSQNDPDFFMDPPADVFDPERFLVPATENKVSKDASGNEYSDEYTFSTATVSHKFWPYGGGKTICPGRVFAKQEILATVAVILLGLKVSVENPKEYKIPGFAKVYGGSGTIPPRGDVRMRLRMRGL